LRVAATAGATACILTTTSYSSAWLVSSPLSSLADAQADRGRRAALLSSGAAVASLLQMPLRAYAFEPLPPPVLQDIVRAAPKIQLGIDWFYFELGDALKNKDLEGTRKATGSAGMGAYVSPVTSEIVLPVNQICSSNLDAEEDGWNDNIRNFQFAIDAIKTEVYDQEWDKALANWKKAAGNVNFIMQNINDRAEDPSKPYFVLIDDAYDSRRKAYRQAIVDKLNYRNAVGSLAMR
ncbi:unnamed protein product, partial [Polarella glacialis]